MMKLGLIGAMGLIFFGCEKPEVARVPDNSKQLTIELERARAQIDRMKIIQDRDATLAKTGTAAFADNEETYRKIVRITSRLANSPNYPGGGEDESWLMLKVQLPMRDRLYKTFGEDVVDHWSKDEIERVFGAMQAKQ